MEDVNSLSELSGTVHCGTDPGGPCNEPDGIGSGLMSCGGCQSGYHTYTMILNRTNTSDESITFYLDGNQYFSVSESQVGTATWQAAFDHNLSIILDLAMGGGYPNGVCDCTVADERHDIGRHDERRLRRRVLHQRRKRHSHSSSPASTSSTPAPTSGSGSGAGATGPITGYRRTVRRRQGSELRQLHARPGVHLQRHQRSAVDRRRRRAAPCTRSASAWTSTAAAPPTGPRWTCTPAMTPRAQVFDPAIRRSSLQPAIGQVPRRYELVHHSGNPAADLGLCRQRQPAVETAMTCQRPMATGEGWPQ